MKGDFLGIVLTSFFGVRNFGNRKVMRVIFFFETLQNLSCISNIQKEIKKRFPLSQIIASELAVSNSVYKEENTCHWQSIC